MDIKKAPPFFSIKWKTLLVFGLLLAISHCVQYLIGYNQIISQFDSQRNREHQYQLAIVHDLIEQSARLMEQTAETIPLVAQNLGQSQSEFGTVISALEQHWENLQTNWGLSELIFYNPNHELKARWGENSSDLISDKQLEMAYQSEAPSFQLSCSTQCYQVVFVPTLATDRNKDHGLIVLVRSLADIIIAFESTTNIDIAILKPSLKDKNNSAGRLKITASSHPERTNRLLTKLQLQHSDNALMRNEIITQMKGLEIGTRLFKLTKESHSNSPYLLLATDLTEQYQLITQAKRQSLYTILIALLISVLLLFSILLKQTQRVISVSSALPALTKGAFQQVRTVLFNSTNSHKWSQDELDLLEESTLLVTNQLEESNKLVDEKTAELTAQNRKIAQEHGFINELLDTAPVIIMTQTISGEIISINRQGCELLHISPSQLIGRQFEETLASPLSKEKWKVLDNLRTGKLGLLRQEAPIKDPQRGVRTISWTHKYLVTQDSEIVTTLTIGQDVTEQKDAEAHLVWIADHDPLTNLFNRRRFQSEFEQQLKIAERYQNRGAVLYFDLDQFKYVNDTSGHSAGDKLLKKVAETLQQVVRTSDTLARLGGDEFALLTPETGAEGASQLAQKIMDKLRAIEFQSDGNIHNISASIGISIFPEHGSSVQDFMSNADLAMYQAKEAGRGRWHLFTPEDQAKELLKTRVLWKEKIETALENERFILHYQPILDIRNNKISHVEALVRMIGDDGEIIMPNDFIPTAEHTGLINQLDITVLRLAFDTLRSLQEANNPLKLSVNLSGRAFSNPELIQFLKKGLSGSDIDAEKLIFEVTETTAVANFSAAKEMMSEIKKTGAKFALDDFGVGYASFYYLRQLPVDYVKIDGSFIRQLAKHKEDQVLVQAIAEISRISGKQTIAEFVEDQSILDLIEAYGIDYAQGYHIAKPSAEIPS